jgi:thiamine-monophosphate kinase
MDEFEIIARYFTPLATAPGAFGLEDDAAIIPARPGFDLVVTTDQIAAGTDFFVGDPAATVAQKALRVNLSDLAAKGARPEYYLLNLALPRPAHEEWLAQFARGLSEDQRQFGISLLGGDTSATQGPLSISVTAMGFVPQPRGRRTAPIW